MKHVANKILKQNTLCPTELETSGSRRS